MHLGIIGLPQSGKTTIFNVLTRGDQPVVTRGGRFEVHTAVVDVPDPRLAQLSEHFKPDKTVFAKVTYADIAGLGSGSGVEISGELLNQLAQMDGFITSCAVSRIPKFRIHQARLSRCATSMQWTRNCC